MLFLKPGPSVPWIHQLIFQSQSNSYSTPLIHLIPNFRMTWSLSHLRPLPSDCRSIRIMPLIPLQRGTLPSISTICLLISEAELICLDTLPGFGENLKLVLVCLMPCLFSCLSFPSGPLLSRCIIFSLSGAEPLFPYQISLYINRKGTGYRYMAFRTCVFEVVSICKQSTDLLAWSGQNSFFAFSSFFSRPKYDRLLVECLSTHRVLCNNSGWFTKNARFAPYAHGYVFHPIKCRRPATLSPRKRFGYFQQSPPASHRIYRGIVIRNVRRSGRQVWSYQRESKGFRGRGACLTQRGPRLCFYNSFSYLEEYLSRPYLILQNPHHDLLALKAQYRYTHTLST